ncbi:hypothetical protein LXL04_005247 [Taraxacum kok-saghyz]
MKKNIHICKVFEKKNRFFEKKSATGLVCEGFFAPRSRFSKKLTVWEFLEYGLAYATMDGSNEESSAIGINEPEISGFDSTIGNAKGLIQMQQSGIRAAQGSVGDESQRTLMTPKYAAAVVDSRRGGFNEGTGEGLARRRPTVCEPETGVNRRRVLRSDAECGSKSIITQELQQCI